MIARIAGKIRHKGDTSVLLDVHGISYEVFLSAASMRMIGESTDESGTVELVTFHYYQIEPSRSFPVLIGFLSEIEKEFFESFITVSGIGPKAAVRALNKPISQIAQAIDAGNTAFLRSLPGIGPQRAKEIVAKLQNKVAKFGLMQDSAKEAPKPSQSSDLEQDVLAVLLQLGYKRQEAAAMVSNAFAARPDVSTTEDLLNEVYRQRKHS
jgi:Holliday junction DNA helicase RuvA